MVREPEIRELEVSHPTQVALLAQQILQLANESRIATWCVVELLPLLKPWHWSAYAKAAAIPQPSDQVIAEAQILYRRLIQYPEATCPTEPAIETPRYF
jgi:hypothetical protein